MRFLILATDGLWDEMSPSHAVALVGAHLAGLRTPSISQSSLAARVPTRVGAAGILGKDASVYAAQAGASNSSGGGGGGSSETGDDEHLHKWTFVDANPSVHLIRNALGGADTGALRRVMSIPAPQTRRFRDDMTVTVVWWEEDGEGGGVGSGLGEEMKVKMGTGMGVQAGVKAKL